MYLFCLMFWLVTLKTYLNKITNQASRSLTFFGFINVKIYFQTFEKFLLFTRTGLYKCQIMYLIIPFLKEQN